MRLVVVTNILAPYRIPLFEAIRSRVDTFTVLLMAEGEENRQWELGNIPFKVQVLPGFHIRPKGYEISLHWNYNVIRTLRKLQPDVVLSGGYAPANMLALLYCKIFRRVFVGWGELTLQEAANSSIIRRIIRRWLISSSNGSIASSSSARETFIHYGAKAQQVLNALMPIEVRHFHERTNSFRKSLQHEIDKPLYSQPVLLSVGRITRHKGYPELFSIYQKLVDIRPEVSLLIIGDGPDRKKCQAYVSKKGWTNVHFVGFVQSLELPRYLALGHLFVFHTLFDPFGAVLSEAMSAGVPVVSSIYAAATKDLVEDGVTGFRIDPRDAESSAAIILKVLSMSEKERAALTLPAYQRVLQHDIEPTADSMVKFMQSLLNAPRPHKQDVSNCGHENSDTIHE